MGDQVISSLVTIALAITGIATLAVLVSNSANTAGVIGATASGFGQDLLAAEAPVTGSGGGLNLASMSGFTGGGSSISPLI